MRRTRIKICGVMQPADARAAAEAGADAVGVILYEKAGRYVEPARAREIVRALPAFVTPVGVFVNESARRVREVAAEVGLRHVQLHGDETVAMVAQLEGLVVIKAVRTDQPDLRGRVRRWVEAAAGMEQLRGLLVDAGAGGEGIENDWEAVAGVQGELGDVLALIAAGGLRAQNVGGVVRRVRPWAVDVSSGVERERGSKSRELMGAFVEAVRAADAAS